MKKQVPDFNIPLSYYRRGVGELQMAYSLPTANPQTGKSKAGAFYLTMGKAIPNGDGKIDWNNKLIFKLSGGDMCLIRAKFQRGLFPIELVHDNSGVKTNLFISPGDSVTKGDRKGLQSFSWTLKRGEQKIWTYLDSAQIDHLLLVCESVMPHLYGWGWAQEVRSIMREFAGHQAPAPAETGYGHPAPHGGYGQPGPGGEVGYYDGGDGHGVPLSPPSGHMRPPG